MLTAIAPITNLIDCLLSPLPTTLAQLLQADMPPSKPALIDWLKLAFAPVAIALEALERVAAPDATEPADCIEEEIGSGIKENEAIADIETEAAPEREPRRTNFASGEHLHPRERCILQILRADGFAYSGVEDGEDLDEPNDAIGDWLLAGGYGFLTLVHRQTRDCWSCCTDSDLDDEVDVEAAIANLKRRIFELESAWNSEGQIEIKFPSEPALQPAPAPAPEPAPLFELKMLSEKVGYFVRTDDGKIICSYAGFSNKATAKRWGDELLSFPQVRFELRPAKRLNGSKWELKIKGLSLAQIKKLSEQDLTRPRHKECAAGRLAEPAPHPLSDEQIIEEGEKAKADLFPPAAPTPAPQPAPQNQPKYGDFMRHTESGFVGSVTASTPKGGILKDANGDNKWVVWTECQPEESLAIAF